VSCTRRTALVSGLFYGLLAAAGCSDTASENKPPLIQGMTPGEYRDKQDEDLEATVKKKKRGRR